MITRFYFRVNILLWLWNRNSGQTRLITPNFRPRYCCLDSTTSNRQKWLSTESKNTLQQSSNENLNKNEKIEACSKFD